MSTEQSENSHVIDRISIFYLKIGDLVAEMLRLDIFFNQIVSTVENLWKNIDQKLFPLVFHQFSNVARHLATYLFVLVYHLEKESVQLFWRF